MRSPVALGSSPELFALSDHRFVVEETSDLTKKEKTPKTTNY